MKEEIIHVNVLPNKRYDYNEEDVYNFLNKDVKRKTVIYARVSTSKQKLDLENQIENLKQFCFSNGYVIAGIYSDTAVESVLKNVTTFLKCLMKSLKAKLSE